MQKTILNNLVEQIKKEILLDIDKGILPKTVQTFSDLHNFVDANLYGETIVDTIPTHLQMSYLHQAQDQVNKWLQNL